MLKEAIRETHEIKVLFDKDFTEIRNGISSSCPGVLHLSAEEELELLENGGAEWLQIEIQREIDKIIEDFSADIEVM